jgi:predicted HAD superfamily Cof-like phosphohydrolase
VPDDLIIARERLLDEEVEELRTAMRGRDLEAAADALADCLYVLLGTAVALGIDLEPVFQEVHSSNMSKTPATEPGGKPTKGAGFHRPAIGPVLGLDRTTAAR